MEWPAEDHPRCGGRKACWIIRVSPWDREYDRTPIEKLFAMLPEGAADTIRTATTKALHAAVRVATSKMDEQTRTDLLAFTRWRSRRQERWAARSASRRWPRSCRHRRRS
jgi:hypothetical protein